MNVFSYCGAQIMSAAMSNVDSWPGKLLCVEQECVWKEC